MHADRRKLRRVYAWILANTDAETDSRAVREQVARMFPTLVIPDGVDSLDSLKTLIREMYHSQP